MNINKSQISSFIAKQWWASRWFNIICVLLLGMMFMLVPIECDDFVYGAEFNELSKGGLTLQEYIDFFKWHYHDMNGRLGDKLQPLFMLFPKWVYVIFTTILMYGMLLLASKLTGESHESKNQIGILLTSLLVLFLPWNDNMFTIAYSFNYIWLITFALVLIIKFFAPPSKLWQQIIIYFLAIFVSSSHELFCIAIGFAMVSYLILNIRKINWYRTIFLIAWGIGGLFIYSSYGFRHRYFTAVDVYEGEIGTLMFIIENPQITFLILAFCATLIVSLLFKRFRANLNKESVSMLVFYSVIIFLNIVIVHLSFRDPRVYFVANFFSAVGLVYIIKLWNYPIKKWVSNIITSIIAILVISHMIVAIYWQMKIFKQYNDIKTLWVQTHNDVIYYDLVFLDDIPAIALSKPNGIEFQTLFYRKEFVIFYGGDIKVNKLGIIPTVLKDFRLDKAEKISSESNIYYYKDCLISDKPYYNRYKNRDVEHVSLNIKFDDGDKVEKVDGFYQEFKDLSGNILYYWQPIYPSRKYYNKQIIAVEEM